MSKHCSFCQFINKIQLHSNSKTLKWYQTYIALSLWNYWCGSILLKGIKQQLLGYTDVGYLSDPHKGRSQIGYMFNCNGTAISWRYVKQTMMATLSNHLEILAIHGVSRECIWLRSTIQHIRKPYGLSSIKSDPIILFEDNVACIAQIKGSYIKEDRTKHILPNSFIHMNFKLWNWCSTNMLKW